MGAPRSISLGWATWNWIKEVAGLIEIPAELLGPIHRGGKRWQHPSIGWIRVRGARIEPIAW